MNRLHILLPFALLLAPAVASAERDDKYSPAALAEKKDQCTLKGRFSAVCLEFYTDIHIKYSPRVERSVREDLDLCFIEAKETERRGKSSLTARTATTLLQRREAGEENVKNKYVEECIAVTETLVPGWREQVVTEIASAAFVKRVKGLLADDFAKKCAHPGQAGMGDSGKPFSILLTRLPAKSKTAVFFKEKDPRGNEVSVLCNGYVVGKTKDGKPFSVAPRTYTEVNAEDEQASQACLDQCLHTSAPDTACLALRQGVTTQECRDHCQNKCRR